MFVGGFSRHRPDPPMLSCLSVGKKRSLVFPIISNQSTFGQADNKHMIDESEHMAFEIIYVKVLSFLIIIKL